MIYDIKWWNGFKAIFRDPNATTADCRGIRHRSAYVRNLVGAGVHSTTTWTKFYPILTTYHLSSGQLWTLYMSVLPFIHVNFLLSTKVPTYLILSTQSLNDPRHCRRYTCRDRSVKHLFSSDVIDQSVCRMLRNHIGHICNVCQMVPNVNVVDMVRESSILWKLVILKYKVCKSSCGRQKSKWLASFVWQMPQK